MVELAWTLSDVERRKRFDGVLWCARTLAVAVDEEAVGSKKMIPALDSFRYLRQRCSSLHPGEMRLLWLALESYGLERSNHSPCWDVADTDDGETTAARFVVGTPQDTFVGTKQLTMT